MELQIGKIIMQTRRDKGMTQETLADMVGVSAAAVSKWETCASYPDITLLPPLARALGLSVDALLDFRRDPAREEQLAISSRLHQVFDDQGFDAGVRAVEAVLREYPHSGSIKLLAGALYYRYIADASPCLSRGNSNPRKPAKSRFPAPCASACSPCWAVMKRPRR